MDAASLRLRPASQVPALRFCTRNGASRPHPSCVSVGPAPRECPELVAAANPTACTLVVRPVHSSARNRLPVLLRRRAEAPLSPVAVARRLRRARRRIPFAPVATGPRGSSGSSSASRSSSSSSSSGRGKRAHRSRRSRRCSRRCSRSHAPCQQATAGLWHHRLPGGGGRDARGDGLVPSSVAYLPLDASDGSPRRRPSRPSCPSSSPCSTM